MAILTTEIQIDRRCHFAHFIFSFDLVKAGVRFDHIVQLEDDRVRVGGDRLDLHDGPVVFGQLGFAPEPRDLQFGASQQTAFEYQPVAVVLLSQLRLLRKTRSEIFGHTHCRRRCCCLCRRSRVPPGHRSVANKILSFCVL